MCFMARDGSPLLTAAGLWDEWKERRIGEPLKSCTMIITEPSEFVAEVHDRMPVLLTEDQFAPWRSGEAGAGVPKPAPNDYLQRWPASKRVNSSKADADNATLIDPIQVAAVYCGWVAIRSMERRRCFSGDRHWQRGDEAAAR
jgi:putative SOS response-associated peptidase YedK